MLPEFAVETIEGGNYSREETIWQNMVNGITSKMSYRIFFPFYFNFNSFFPKCKNIVRITASFGHSDPDLSSVLYLAQWPAMQWHAQVKKVEASALVLPTRSGRKGLEFAPRLGSSRLTLRWLKKLGVDWLDISDH